MRLYTTITAFLVLFLFSTLSLSAQNYDRADDAELKGIVRDYIRAGRTTNKSTIRGKRIRSTEDRLFKKIGLSLGVGTNGIGLRMSTPIDERFKLRVGGDFFPASFSVNKKIKINDEALRTTVGGYYPDYDVDLKPQMMTGHVLVSYYPVEEIPFYVTAGLYLGANQFKGKGQLINPATGEASTMVVGNEWPLLRVDNYALDIDGGKLNADLKIGAIVKPYLGIGYGYIVPESNWSFTVDLGTYFQSGFNIYQNGKEALKYKQNEGNTHVSSAVDIKKYKNTVRFWPVLAFQISYRIY